MKIAIDARELRTSTGRYVERLVHYLQQIDHTNDYTILLKPKDMDGWQPSNPRFRKIACPHQEFTVDEQVGFKKQLDQLGADLVHFSIVNQPIWYTGKTVTTMHDLIMTWENNPARNPVLHRLKQQVYKWVNKRAARKSDAIITPTQFIKDDVVRFTHVDAGKITVTLEAADVLPAKPVPVSSIGNKPFIMYVGRPMPHKNLARLIDAFALVQTTQPELHLVLVGKTDSNYERHAAYVREQKIPNVIFTGFTSDAQLRWLYEHTRAYVFPSFSEGFGLPPLEAMLHGAPVVASNATCIPEVLGQAANYFDPYDIPAMATAIEEVLVNQKLRQTLIADGRKQVKKYSWKRMAEQTLAVYNQALSEPDN